MRDVSIIHKEACAIVEFLYYELDPIGDSGEGGIVEIPRQSTDVDKGVDVEFNFNSPENYIVLREELKQKCSIKLFDAFDSSDCRLLVTSKERSILIGRYGADRSLRVDQIGSKSHKRFQY